MSKTSKPLSPTEVKNAKPNDKELNLAVNGIGASRAHY